MTKLDCFQLSMVERKSKILFVYYLLIIRDPDIEQMTKKQDENVLFYNMHHLYFTQYG